MGSDAVGFLRADVERLCAELVDLPPVMRLRTLAELRAMADEVTSQALSLAMVSARGEGWDCGVLRSLRTFRMSRCVA